MLDTREIIETPEGAELPLELAGILIRACAYSIDWSIRAVFTLILFMTLAIGGHLGMGFSLIFYFLIEWFYPVIFEVWRKGATPGKKMMGLAVVNDDGTPIGFSSSLLRNLLMAVDFLPFFYAAGIVSSLSHSQFKRLGDIAAGTLVIHRPRSQSIPTLDSSLGLHPLPPGLSSADQRALVAFAERHNTLNPSRQQELANILMPLLANGPTSQTDAVVTILQMANSIAGHQRSTIPPA